MIDQNELLNRCLSLRSNFCLKREQCERLLEEAPYSWTVEQLHDYRELRDDVASQIQQLDRHLATLQGLEESPPKRRQSPPWSLIAFAALFLLLVIAAT